ncbi:MAG: TetR/AcrR family transcriptional regulator [Acetanaerobacterium sp.]
MNNPNTDRRVRKTKKLLISGLTQLMEAKSVKDITVRELSDLIDINRGTFYLHYKDIFDMVNRIEDEMFDEFNKVLTRHPYNELNGKPLPMLIDIFHFVYEYADMCKVLLGKNGDIAFVEKLKGIVKDKCLNDWMEIYNTEKTQNFGYFYAFIVSGCIGLLQNWLENDMKQTAEQMAVLAEEMIMTGVKALV